MLFRSRLSNDLANAARQTLKAAALVSGGQLGEAAYRHGEIAVEALALVAASEHWGPARLAEAARELAAIVVPEFPVTGHDLAGLGIKPGPALGLELKRLERAWIDSGFALGKTDLLLRVKA